MDEDLYLSLENLNVTTENEKEQEIEEQIDSSDALITKSDSEEITGETEDKDEEDKEGKEEKTPSSESNDSSSTISVFANYLKEEGVLSSELVGTEKIESLEDLKNLMIKQIESERHSDLSDGQKRYLESLESGVPLSEYESMEKEISWIGNISIEELEENGQLRFDIIVMDLIGSGLTEQKAVAIAQRSVDSGKDQEDSKESIQSLYDRKVEQFSKTVETKKEEKQATIEEVKKTIEAKEFIMGDIKLSKENKSEILKLMTTQVDTTEEGQPLNEFGKWRRENGLEAEIILNALYINTNGFKNLGEIKSQVSSKSAQDLEKRLRSLDKEDLSRSLQGAGSSKGGMTLQ